MFVQSPVDVGATGSDVNNDGAGSPESNGSPTAPVQRKKPRTATCEITEEPTPEATTETPPPSPNEERVVNFYSQYLALTWWRAVENYEVWDHRLVKAFIKGPRAFAAKVHDVASLLGQRLRGKREINPEAVSQSYLERFRPRGLYEICARIFQQRAIRNERPLKRKQPEAETEIEKFSLFAEGPSKKFKHRFLMAQPRLIVHFVSHKGIA